MQLSKLVSLVLLIVGLSLTSCSEDTERFTSTMPRFSAIRFKALSDGSENLQVGQPFVAVAEQKQQGKLLNTTRYTWTVDREDEITHRYASNSIIYDNKKDNPTDTIVAKSPGFYTLTLTAEYSPSGIAEPASFTENIENNGTAQYASAAIRMRVVLRQKFRVR